MNADTERLVEVKLELEGSPAERVPAGEVELLAAVAEGMPAPAALLSFRVQRVLPLVVLLTHF